MYISNLAVFNFRNIDHVELSCSPTFNLITGENGAGKTSLLEAAHVLATGKSFRTHLPSRYIAHDHPAATVTAKIYTDNLESTTLLGMEKHRQGDRILKINREPVDSIAKIASICPIQMVEVDCHRIFSDGPKVRRSFLDWGVFHVKPHFLDHSLQYNRILKQRNALLKSQQSQATVTSWDQLLIEHGNIIDQERSLYLVDFIDIFNEIIAQLLGDTSTHCKLSYKPGWREGGSLATALQNSYSRDQKYGTTHAGPHRADCQLYSGNIQASDELSQGQLKVAAYALQLAQGILLKKKTGKSPAFLIDDLPSELDKEKQGAVIKILKSLNCQVFITAISSDHLLQQLDEEGTSVFHVEHGKHQNQSDKSSKTAYMG